MRQKYWIFAASLILLAPAGCGGGQPGDDLAVADNGVPDAIEDTVIADDGAPVDAGRDASDTIDDAVADSGVDIPGEDTINTDIPGDTGPETYVRPDRGEPVTQEEIDRVTAVYIDILQKTRYFDVLDERIHGLPRPPEGGDGPYWYGTWWSGITMSKLDGRVTFTHSPDGADNNGMRTGPMLVGACYAAALDGRARDFGLVRRIVRGFNSWAMTFRSPTFPEWENTQVLSRASYPRPATADTGGVLIDYAQDGHEYSIDYSLNWPGMDNGACEYVHVPDNPYWGDIYAKNKRSKDDIGHMMIALASLAACPPMNDETDPEMDGLREDISEAMEIYRAWAAQVDADGWKIATVDKDGTIYYPDEDLAFLWLDLGNIECEAATTLRLFHGGDPGDLNCGDGIHNDTNPELFGEEDALKNDFHQIQRSFHESAIMHAWLAGRDDVANELLAGLAWRVDKRLDELEGLTPPADPHYSDLGELVLMSGNSGLPLTWRDVRFLHARIDEAHAALIGDRTDAQLKTLYDVFSADVPDGPLSYDLCDTGLAWRYMGAVLGACASPWWSAASKPFLNCDMIRGATF